MTINQDILLIKDKIVEAVAVEKVYLFGSYAYGTPNGDSDYDFYIVIPDDSESPAQITRKVYKALRGLKRKPVDILVGYASNFENRTSLSTLERTIKREGVMLYEQ